METSAKASINVEDAFFTLARDIKAKMEKKLVRLLPVKFPSTFWLDQQKNDCFILFSFVSPVLDAISLLGVQKVIDFVKSDVCMSSLHSRTVATQHTSPDFFRLFFRKPTLIGFLKFLVLCLLAH